MYINNAYTLTVGNNNYNKAVNKSDKIQNDGIKYITNEDYAKEGKKGRVKLAAYDAVSDIYEAIQNGDLQKAAEKSKKMIDYMGSFADASFRSFGDFTILELTGNVGIFYKGQHIEDLQAELPKKIDEFTGFEYITVGDYHFMTDRYRFNYDRDIEKLAKEKGMTVEEIHENNIFTQSTKKFNEAINNKAAKASNTDENMDFDNYFKFGISPFNRLMAFLTQKENFDMIKSGKMGVEDIKKELQGYVDFEQEHPDFNNLDIGEQKRLMEGEFFALIDRHNERMRKLNIIYEEQREKKLNTEENIEKAELEKKLKDLNMEKVNDYVW